MRVQKKYNYIVIKINRISAFEIKDLNKNHSSKKIWLNVVKLNVVYIVQRIVNILTLCTCIHETPKWLLLQTVKSHMRGSRKLCQRGPTLTIFFFDEGREDQKTTRYKSAINLNGVSLAGR